ncbi:TetR/AcrR family transcriptional regulator [Vallitalea maricola]|uniref:TetR/AcrR family transcriptional regulator n=1 Tax=Vallitalea maricola TaxID=3074433 RepID=A0ACB5UQX2_9FIRM|nr:TetR/AcrR family transcriptional regulator [Vallitalea sp. AN17-2]
MNKRFFDIPEEKQINLFHAGCKIFANNPYRNASMSKVAYEAGISKSLIFYYFQNKQEYYFFILNEIVNQLNSQLLAAINNKVGYDLFEKIFEIIEFKKNYFSNLNLHYKLINRIYFETDDNLIEGLQQLKMRMSQPYKELIGAINKTRFTSKADATNCMKILLYCAEGIVYHYNLEDSRNWDVLVDEYKYVIKSMKYNYYKELK